MPAVIIKMLVASEPGRISLLPALPSIWSSGEIQGVLCRGQIEIKRLKWENGQIEVVLLSGKDQTINLEAFDKSQRVRLRAGREVIVTI